MRLRLNDVMVPVSDPALEETRTFYSTSPRGRGPDGPDELREARARRTSTATDDEVVEEIAEVGPGRVPIRIITPRSGPARAVHLDFHGGGFYMGAAADDDTRNRKLAEALGIAVVSVDYRLAPEHPWPAAPDDCRTAALWVVNLAETRFGTPTVTLGGFSAGATLAMTTLVRLRDAGMADQIVGAALQFGTWDLSGTTPAGRRIADEYFLQAYAGEVSDRTVGDVSPIYADLHELPPMLLVIGERDILLEDNMAMATRLSVAGCDVDLRVYPDAPHGFTAHPTPVAAVAVDDIETWLDQRIADAENGYPGATGGSRDGSAQSPPWDDASVTALRGAIYSGGAELVDLLRSRPFHAALQHVGDALMKAVQDDVAGAREVAGECVAALEVRGWEGDAELAEQMQSTLNSTTLMLRPLPIDLEELSSSLEGDIAHGGGRIDLQTGQTWPDELLDFGVTDEFSEDDLEDPDRWLEVECIGSRDGYRDMEDFVASVADPALVEHLRNALIGKGAFRRFKDVLWESPDEFSRYQMFSDERQRGRAREWLTRQGYRVQLPRSDE